MINISVLVDIDECEDEPCVHGTCTDMVADFECSCEDGFSGTRCEIGQLVPACR